MNAQRNLYLALVTLGALSPLSPSFSAELDSGVRTVSVSLAGLDLSNPKQMPTVYRRIKVAAQSVCKNLSTLELGQRRAKWQRCVEDATGRAVVDIDAPALTAHALSTSGAKPTILARDR